MTAIDHFMMLNFGLLLSALCFSKHLLCFCSLQTKAEMERFAANVREGHHLSPGSVLEASFSSSSLDESPGMTD